MATNQERWATKVAALREYVEEHGRLPRQRHGDVDELVLGSWIMIARQAHRLGKLSAERTADLEAVPCWRWDGRRRPAVVRHLGIVARWVDANPGVAIHRRGALKASLALLDRAKADGLLTEEELAVYDALAVASRATNVWTSRIAALKAFQAEAGFGARPDGTTSLGFWTDRAIRQWREGRLSQAQIRDLSVGCGLKCVRIGHYRKNRKAA